MRILLVEDNLGIGTPLLKKLSQNYVVDWIKDGAQALYEATTNDYCLIILDVGLPSMSGIDVCKELRKRKITTPIIFLSSYDSTQDKITGLNIGADDYLPKPFVFSELQARINSLLRNKTDSCQRTLTVGKLSVHPATREVFYKNQPIILNYKEYLLLKYLLHHKGKIVTKIMIWAQVWENPSALSSNIIEVCINKLRNKIDRKFGVKIIHTVHKVGYFVK